MTQLRLTAVLPWVLAALCLVGGLSANIYVLQITTVMCLYAISALGLDVLFGLTGQLSMGQGVFLGIGAYSSALLVMRQGFPPVVAIAAGVVITMAAAMLLSVPLLRLKGYTFALATLALPMIAEDLARGLEKFTGGPAGLKHIPPFTIGGLTLDSPRTLYPLVFLLLIVALAGVLNLKDSRLGRAWRVIKADETAALAMGIDVGRLKLLAFIISAAYAGVAGGFYSFLIRFISPDMLNLKASVESLVMVVIGGAGSVWGLLGGVLLVRGAPELIQSFRDYQVLVYGVVLTVVLLWFPQGIAGGLQRLFKRILPQAPNRHTQAVLAYVPEHAVVAKGNDELLRVEHLNLQFGGLKVVDDLSFTVRRGTIKAIIGPNGAGKTTTINLVTGHLTPNSGRVLFKGEDITGRSPHRIAQAGILRTFQLVRLVAGTVVENVAVGFHRRLKAGFWSAFLRFPARQEEARTWAEAMGLLEFVGLVGEAEQAATSLASGHQRLLELARALAGRPELLVVDEPAAGLSEIEVNGLRKLLFTLRDAGMTIILIEHNMNLIMDVSDEVLVLAEGRKIAEGVPAVVQRDPEVLRVYLGTGGEAA